MKLKYKVKQQDNGKWYVYRNTKTYWVVSYETEQAAIEASLLREGLEISDRLDDVQRRMASVPGMIDPTDPYGWRA